MFSRQFQAFSASAVDFRSRNSIKESVRITGLLPRDSNILVLSGFSISDCQTIRPFFLDFHINAVGEETFSPVIGCHLLKK